MPLSEERIRKLLFNPATFDISTAIPRDPSLVEATMPPQRSGMGMGGEYKMASAEASFFQSLEKNASPEEFAKKQRQRKAAEKWGGSEKTAYDITPEKRKDIPKKEFAQPGKKAPEGEGGGKGKYPIPDAQHYRTALGFAKMHGDTAAYAAIKAKGKKMGYEDSEKEKRSFLGLGKTTISKGYFGLMKTNPNSEELDRAFKLYQEKTGKHPNEMTYEDINKHVQMVRAGNKSGGKEKSSSLLLEIAPTLREADVDAFTEKLASDPYLVAGLRGNGMAPILVEALENTKRASAEDRMLAIAEGIEPTVVTLQKLPGGEFLVKSASNKAFTPDKAAKGQVVPEEEAAQAIGPENAQQMQPGQTATAVSDPVENVEPEAPSKAKIVEEYGQYKVEDALGNSLLGHVFPQTLAWDGLFTPQGTALFTNGSAYAFQDTVAGELVGKGTNLPDDEPRGDGCFYCVEGGDAIVTQPLTIGSAMAGPDGLPRLQATDSFGNPIVISQTEGLKQPMRIDGNEFAIPENWKFMRLNNQTQVATSPDALSKVGAAHAAENEVELIYNGGYHIRGGCGLQKIARDFRYDLDPVGAEFMLGLLGVDGATAKVKVAEARKKGFAKMANLKDITLLGERFQQAEKTASAFLAQVPDLRVDLSKEAAALDDGNSVDKILALNFINPENLETFINYLPELEETSEHLAEMLLYSYLGMNQLPETAIDRSMRGMEQVITGLKGIAGSEV
jgi:hypothetical protein